MNYKLFVFLNITSIAFCVNYPCVDINFTPYSGAENILFMESSIEKLDNFLFPIPSITLDDLKNPESCSYFSGKNKLLRGTKLMLFWLPFGLSCSITQHEIFGHGYRIRDLGNEYATVEGYGMFILGGYTSYDMTHRLTMSQLLSINIAGLEADAILAYKTRCKWLEKGKIDPREFTQYISSALSLTGYVFSSDKYSNSVQETGDDITNFLFGVNCIYRDSHISYRSLRNLSLINLLDPFFYYSILSTQVYTSFGQIIKVPMFHIGPVQYLPVPRIALTPFGIQGYLENYFLVNSVPVYCYMKWGKNGANTYYGSGIENREIFKWKTVTLGFRADWWFQPQVLFEQGSLSAQEISNLPEGTKISEIPPLYPNSMLTKRSLGAAFSTIASYAWVKWPLTMFVELGYKSAGYLPGEALRQSPIARGGFSGQF